MFQFVLGGSLVLGAFLLGVANYSEGTVVEFKTAAQGIGWLLLAATIAGVLGLRHASFGRLGAAVVTFLSGLAVLYVSYFEWGPVLDAPIRHAAAQVLPAQEPVVAVQEPVLPAPEPVLPVSKPVLPVSKPVLPASEPVYKRIDPELLTPTVTPVSVPATVTVATKVVPLETKVAPQKESRDACAAESGITWVVCRERARLEYCAGREDDAVTCPSAIPYSPPG